MSDDPNNKYLEYLKKFLLELKELRKIKREYFSDYNELLEYLNSSLMDYEAFISFVIKDAKDHNQLADGNGPD